ncbi:unnamed protein product [Linum trigynum]|uniref:Uncharacterized protein n=1 Tax=Linum trigynum TaxID=586398 RepID=A0AAV2EKX3_9ROSI
MATGKHDCAVITASQRETDRPTGVPTFPDDDDGAAGLLSITIMLGRSLKLFSTQSAKRRDRRPISGPSTSYTLQPIVSRRVGSSLAHSRRPSLCCRS